MPLDLALSEKWEELFRLRKGKYAVQGSLGDIKHHEEGESIELWGFRMD